MVKKRCYKMKKGSNSNTGNVYAERYVYLAGKINRGSDSTNYRKRISRKFLAGGLHCLDPLRGKYNERNWDNYTANEVVNRDIQDLKRAHIVFAVIADDGGVSFGTPCEIALAAKLFNIPVVLVTDIPYLYEHFWTRSFCSRIFLAPKGQLDETIERAVEHTIHWYGNDIEQEIYKNPKEI